MIFVDTGVWYASLIEGEPHHQRCQDLIDGAAGELLTTDYVVDELLTLLTVRGHRASAVRMGDRFCRETYADL